MSSFLRLRELFFIVSVILFCSTALSILPNAPFELVITSTGPIRGQLQRTIFENRSYYSFKGIPYAQPPTYHRRFLPPLPVETWTKPRNCFDFGNICPQYNPLNKSQLVGDEDCLFLNVYTPVNVNSNDLKPVMVYIHGGGFYFGSGNDDIQGPDLLINEGVILVTMNYRIGVLGFLSLGTPEYSGNQGLKDQQLALKWIQSNIRRFGGDPDSITIFGQSAGSASCHFHVIAPGSRGLFKQTIEMSSTFDVWSIFERGDHLEDMYRISKHFGFKVNRYEDLVGFLKSVDSRLLIESCPIVQFYPDRTPIEIKSKWLPVVENSAALQPFMQSTPTEMLVLDSFDMQVNVMMGYTTAESLFFNTPDCVNPSLLNALNQRFAIELPSIHFERDYNSSDYKQIADEIRNFYFPNGVAINLNQKTLQSFVQLMSHVYQNYPIDRMARLMAKESRGTVHFYRFGLDTRLNYYKNLLGAQNQTGASHADDLCYVFRCGLIDEAYAGITVASAEYRLIKMMTGLYVNFARHSNPMPNMLEAVRPDQLNFVDITANGLVLDTEPLAEYMEFWTKLMSDHPLSMGRDVDQFVDKILNSMQDNQNKLFQFL